MGGKEGVGAGVGVGRGDGLPERASTGISEKSIKVDENACFDSQSRKANSTGSSPTLPSAGSSFKMNFTYYSHQQSPIRPSEPPKT